MPDNRPSFTVFLDANVLAKPVTRTVLMLAGGASGYATVWSAYVDAEADRHLRTRQRPASEVRKHAGRELSDSGDVAARFVATSASDRQVLADAVQAQALFIVTEDVDDFAAVGLDGLGIAAVNPDLFLSVCTSEAGYVEALDFIAGLSHHPRTTPEELHVALGRVHPLTVEAHATAFARTPMPMTHHPPAVVYRGSRCLRCLRVGASVTRLDLCEAGGCERDSVGPTV